MYIYIWGVAFNRNYKGHMGAGGVNTRDMKETMQGKWMREDKIDPYETENRKVFQVCSRTSP